MVLLLAPSTSDVDCEKPKRGNPTLSRVTTGVVTGGDMTYAHAQWSSTLQCYNSREILSKFTHILPNSKIS